MSSAILIPSSACGRVVMQVPGKRTRDKRGTLQRLDALALDVFLLFALPRWRGEGRDEKTMVQGQAIAGMERENNATVTLSDCQYRGRYMF